MRILECGVVVVVASGAVSWSAPAAAQEGMSEEMARRLEAATATTDEHRALERFVGEWSVEITLSMPGGEEQQASGQATYEWLIPERWIGQRLTDDLFGQEHRSFSILGWDSYAKSYVLAGVSSFDNALGVSRGPKVDPEGRAIVTYGTLDEYLTGDLHKPYKIVTRITGPDSHVVEVWDLGVGVEGTKVLEYRYARRRVRR